MSYICMDRGTEKCPCALLEAGQCYTCSMISKGICSCDWQGVCPYTEYMQAGETAVSEKDKRKFSVVKKYDFSSALSTVTLDVPFAYSMKCRARGAFVMVFSSRHVIPLSVMESNVYTEKNGSLAGRITLAINMAGPKTSQLLKQCRKGDVWDVAGPYFTGLIEEKDYDPRSLTLAVAKGIAVMPLINIKKEIGGSMAGFFLDSSKLPAQFEKTYLGDIQHEHIDLLNKSEEAVRKIRNTYDFCIQATGKKPNIFLMVSPYYEEILLNLLGLKKHDVIRSNHSTMCCGEGICGACSYMDKNGVTFRGCKCMDI